MDGDPRPGQGCSKRLDVGQFKLSASNLIGRFYQQLDSLWTQSGAWPDFIEVMRLALAAEKSKESRDGENILHWADLPGACCQAVGGDPDWADDLTLAWLLFYSAAGLIDSLQDHDEPDAWWLGRGPGVALSAATGIYFSASSAINNLHNKKETRSATAEVVRDFYQTLLVMSSGQYRELVTPEPALDQYWKFVEAKSGAFFSLACRSGARLATRNQPTIQAFGAYGMRLGLLIQVLDDLEDIRMLQDPLPVGMLRKIRRSLPVLYAIEVSNPAQKESLRALINSNRDDLETVEGLIKHVDQCGAALYVLTEIERQRQLAVDALGGISANESVDKLINLARNL